MKFFGIILQIGELFRGNFNWPGAISLGLFIVMGAILGGLCVFLGYQAFKPKDK